MSEPEAPAEALRPDVVQAVPVDAEVEATRAE